MSSVETVSSDPVIQLAELWSTFFELADTQRRAILECYETICDPSMQRTRWLGPLTEAMNSYATSTAYLDLMQSSFRSVARLKALQYELLRDFAHKLSDPLVSDDQEVFDRLRLAEVTLVTRLEAIEDRLAKIETRLDISLSPG
jgi:hypothetical protein